MSIRRCFLATFSLLMVFALVQTIVGSTPSKPPLPTGPSRKTGPESVYDFDLGTKLVLSTSDMPKAGAAVAKTLLPATSWYETLNLNLELRDANGTSVLLARRLMQITNGEGDVLVRIIKASQENSELVVVFSMRSNSQIDKIGIWHVALVGDSGRRINSTEVLDVAIDELTFIRGAWSMDSQPLRDISDKTVGVGLKRDNAGRWTIELSEPGRHPNMAPAIFEQKDGCWDFTRTRMLGDFPSRGR